MALTKFKPRTNSTNAEFDVNLKAQSAIPDHVGFLPLTVLLSLLALFVFLQFLLPLRTAVKIGADEGFELAKATLCLKGYKLYTEIWNDQPPLDTFLITQILKYVSPSVFGPRLLSVVFAALLLSAVFVASFRLHGLLAAALATMWLIASPGFLELSCSVMQEIPALTPAVGALSVLLLGRRMRWHGTEIFGGILFAAALQMKFIGVVYLPLIVLILWLRCREIASVDGPSRGATSSSGLGPFPVGFVRALSVFGVSLSLGFVAILFLTGETGPYLLQIKQSWEAHFASAKSFEYGSPTDHRFDWSVLLKNWDTTIPAVLGVILILPRVRSLPIMVVPVAWLALTLAVFATYKPWWTYYYIHTAVPLCCCASIGIAGSWQRIRQRRSMSLGLLFSLFVLGAAVWMGARVYLQITSIRQSPHIHGTYVLTEVARLKPFTRCMYTDEPVLSFHTGIPLPPRLGVISLKRFWSGDLTNARLAEELWRVKPGIMLLKNTSQEQPFSDLITAEYRLVYFDAHYRLYGHRTLLDQVKQ